MSDVRKGHRFKLIQGQSVLNITGNKKRRRLTGDNQTVSKRRNSLPDLTDLDNTEDSQDKTISKITETMSSIHVETNDTNMLAEIKKMEERLSEKITSNKEKEISELEERLNNNIRSTIDSSIKDALQVMQTSFCTAVQNNPTIKSHSVELRELKEENLRLNRKVQQLTTEHNRMKRQMTKIETKGLDQCLIIRGVPEEMKETDQMIFDKLHNAFSSIMQGETEDEKINASKQLTFHRCRRLGRYSKTRPRPLSVEMTHKQDTEFILENRFDLPRGIYVDREYPIDIEWKRKTLLPVLKVAKRLSNYKKQSRLEDDKLVLKGRSYNVNTLNQLPEELNVFKVTSKEDEATIGFFGEINPLSNFYPSPFIYEGIHYISSEQWIQANKAKFSGDIEMYNEILCCSTSLECKILSKQIRNMNGKKWEDEAMNICLPGIRAKFHQNANAMDILINKTGTKKIVECASDRLWGTGMPLNDPACLDHSKWISQGILGQILECIREEVLNSRIQFYHMPESRHAPDLASGMSLSAMGDPTGAESCTSASTTPTSDTTASDTDPGDAPNHHTHPTVMDGIQPATNSF